METRRTSRLIVIPPPAVYAVTFAIGLAIDHGVHWRPGWMHSLPWTGWGLLILGIVLAPGSAGLFGLKRTTLNPAGHPSRLVTGGAYRISRNPMYLGLALVYAGLAIVLDRAWPLILLPVPLVWIDVLVIPFEEARMRERFGDEFLAYCKRVRRWI